MQSAIVKWGNSQGIRIPKTFLKSVHLAHDDPVDIKVENGKIIIAKCSAIRHKTTKERLVEFYGNKTDQKSKHQKEIDWGSPRGKEKW